MIPPLAALAVVVICFVGALLASRSGASTAATTLLVVAAYTVYARLRFGSVTRAWRAAGRGDLDTARRLVLGAPLDGRLLSRHYRAGRELLLSVAALEEGDLDSARAAAELSLSLESTEHNRAMGHACLARVAAAVGDAPEARKQLSRATELRFKPSLKGALEEVREELARLEDAADGEGEVVGEGAAD